MLTLVLPEAFSNFGCCFAIPVPFFASPLTAVGGRCTGDLLENAKTLSLYFKRIEALFEEICMPITYYYVK